jgi:predicted nucleic acid-binding protein
MTADSKSFIDSNIWLYSFIATQNAQKTQKALELIKKNRNNICLSTQVINEVCFNLKRKEGFEEKRLTQVIARFYFD